MIEHWQKISLDGYINNLKDYYNNCEKSSFRLANKVQELTEEERQYVNANINLEAITGFDKSILLNSILAIPEKINFATHLLISDNIDFEINGMLNEKSSFVYLLDLLINKTDDFYYSMNHFLLILYKRGYTSKDCDGLYLKNLYKNLPSQKVFIFWCMARFAFLLNDYEKFDKVYRNEKVLFTILSFKLKKPVGINYPNLLGIANSAIQHYRDNGDMIIKAMHKYEVYEEILSRDKKKVFQEKKADFDKFKPIQDSHFQEIITTLFPELK